MIRMLQQAINILFVLLAIISFIALYFSHLDIAETKNEQLKNEMINEINSFNNIEEIKKDYILYLESVDNFRKEHNSESHVEIYLFLLSIIMLLLNNFYISKLAKKKDEIT